MSQNWKYRILNHSENPPGDMWQRIAVVLDSEKMNTGWIEKMQLHEEAPPAFVWENISEKLDEKELLHAPGWVKKIKDHKEEPPVSVWDKISAALDGSKAKVISISGRKWVYRIAAAASFAGVITLGIWLFNKSGNNINTNGTVAVTPGENKNTQQQNETSETTSVTNTSETNKKETAVTEPSGPGNHELKKEKEKEANTRAETDIAAVKDPFENDNTKINPQDGNNQNETDIMPAPNTYVTVAGPNGQTVKVSSKLSKMLGLLHDGDKADKEKLDMIIDQSKFWNSKFKQWRDKMLYNTVSPAPDNFMDIQELMNIVNEKN